MHFFSFRLAALVFLFGFLEPCANAQLVASPADFKIWVEWRNGRAEDGDRLGGHAKIHLDYNRPSGTDISSVRAQLTNFLIDEVNILLPVDYAEPPVLWTNDEANPTYLEMATGENGVYGSLLSHIIPWPTRSFHNGKQAISADLEVTVNFVNGQTQILNYHSHLTPIVRNLTVDDISGVNPVPLYYQKAMMGEPTNRNATPPIAAPAFILAAGASKTFTCVVNTALFGSVHLRYDVFSCDNPDEVLRTYETTMGAQGLSADGLCSPAVNTWTWDGTKTVGVWDEWENYHEEQIPVGRGLYQVRITAEMAEDSGEGYGSSVADYACLRWRQWRFRSRGRPGDWRCCRG